MEEQAVATVALYVRIPPTLHARVKRVSAAREKTVKRLVQRALWNELLGLGAGRVLADAIRKGSRRLG